MNYQEQLEIGKIAISKTYNTGDYLFHAGDISNKLFIIHKGHIKISRYNIDGDEQIIRILGPGDFIGEKSFLSHGTLDNYAISLEKTEVCEIDSKAFKDKISLKPEILFKIMEELSKRLYHAEDKIENMNLLTVEKRVAKAILDFKLKQIVLPISKREWANELGMSSEALSRTLKIFKDQGDIELKGQRIIILLDRENLEEILKN